MYVRSLVLCWVVVGGLGWPGPAVQASSSFESGRRDYQSYRFAKAIPRLLRALRSPTTLAAKKQVEAHLMLAICYYNLARSRPAATHFRAALQLDRTTTIPAGQSPPALAYFRKIRREWLQSHPAQPTARRREPPAQEGQPSARRGVVLSPVAVRKEPVAVRKEPVAAVLNAQPPLRRPLRPRQAKVKLLQPVSIQPAQRSIWQRHRISIITGAVGIVALGVGVGLGAAFQGERAEFEAMLQQPTSSGLILYTLYQRSEQLVLPANVMLLSGGIILAGAAGVFVAEFLLHRKAGPTR